MNCLEKMYHNHLPLNAFTSRFPNARAKAMLTLMLDGHRQECDSCDKILDDANVGIFHGDEQKLKMDLGNYYTLFIINKRFALNEMYQRNASKFAIFYV